MNDPDEARIWKGLRAHLDELEAFAVPPRVTDVTNRHSSRRLELAVGAGLASALAVVTLVGAAVLAPNLVSGPGERPTTVAPTMRPPGSSVTFSLVVRLDSAATTNVTLTDTSGIVEGATSVDRPSIGLSNTDYDALTRRGYVVVAVPDSYDVGLVWSSGVCYPEQTVAVSGTARHLNIAIRLIPPSIVGICEAVGGGPALRLAMATPIDLKNITVSVVRP